MVAPTVHISPENASAPHHAAHSSLSPGHYGLPSPAVPVLHLLIETLAHHNLHMFVTGPQRAAVTLTLGQCEFKSSLSSRSVFFSYAKWDTKEYLTRAMAELSRCLAAGHQYPNLYP